MISSTSSQVIGRKQVDVKGDGQFQFSSVLPATYSIEISEDTRCWEKQSQQLVVSSDIDNIIFKQLGYYVTVNSRHATVLAFTNKDGKTFQEVSIRKGENVICVNSNDIVSLSTKGCEEFDIVPNKINLKDIDLTSVTLKPIRYRVSGKVETKKIISDLGLTAKVRLDFLL